MLRNPEATAESAALVRALGAYPTIDALKSSPDWPALGPRLERLLSTVRRHTPPQPPGPPLDPARVHAVHWNIEHGNWYDQVEGALLRHHDLRNADLLFFNEIDVGMARAGNRDVAADLSRSLQRHGVWAALFLETTSGRDDDAHMAGDRVNQEALFGIAVLSRWPIGEVRLVPLPGPEEIQFRVERMFGRFIAIVAEVQRPGAPFVAVSVHLEVHRTRRHRAEQMRVLLEALRDEQRPIILAGDFNSHTFDRGTWRTPFAGARALLLEPGPSLRRRFLHPDKGPHHEPVFDELQRHGFEWEPYTDHRPTLKVRFERLEEATPMRLLGPLGTGIRRFGERRGQLRLDWFAGRGWRGGRGVTAEGLDGPGEASDHAPIMAEFE
jgi:endonuclease/exonuclease/phosphatase family metal-dependent hydrolase